MLDHLLGLLPFLRPPEAEILRARLGFGASSEGEATLAVLGERSGVSRERIRQRQESGLATIEARTGLVAILGTWLLERVAAAPIDLADLRAEPWAASLADEAFRFFLGRCAGVHVVRVGRDIAMACDFHRSTWEAARRRLDRIVEAAGLDDPREALLERLDAECGGLPELRACMPLARRLLEPHGTAIQAKASAGLWDDIVDRILPPPGRPMQRSEAWQRVRDSGVTELCSDLRFDMALGRIAVHMGNGSHVRIPSGGDHSALVEGCLAVMRAGKAGRRWSTKELCQRLGRAGAVAPDGAVLEGVLSGNPAFERLRPMVWRLASANGGPSSFPDAAVAVLERLGKPSPGKELVKAALRDAGHMANPQIMPGARLCLLDRAVWGLADRDIPIAPGHRASLVSLAVATLAAGERHLPSLYGAIAPACREAGVANHHLLGSLLRLDAGYRIGRGNVLWDGSAIAPPRPGSLKAAVLDILRSADGGVSRSEVMERAEAAFGRRPSIGSVSQALLKFGRKTGPGHWTLGRPITDPPGRRPSTPRPRAKPAARAKPKPSTVRKRTATKPPGTFRHYPKSRKLPQVQGTAFDWTPEREETLRSMILAGSPSRMIVEALGGSISRSAVNGKVFRLGLAVPAGDARTKRGHPLVHPRRR